jgi:iron complex transport system substrate-binding protein
MKIVSLLPAATEILCDMGLTEYISAVSHECDYPSIVKNKIKITSSIIPNNSDQNGIDKLVKEAITNNIPLYEVDTVKLNAINPDLIITQGLCDVCSISEDKIQATLKNNLCTLSSNTKIISLNGVTFDDICSDILTIGKAVNKEDIANKIIKEAVCSKLKISKKKKVRVLYFFLNGLILTLVQAIGYLNKLRWLVLYLQLGEKVKNQDKLQLKTLIKRTLII